jgi:hypothetical protein
MDIRLIRHPHSNPVVRACGIDPTDPYLEWCWLPVVGPSTVALMRRLADLTSATREARIPLADLGRLLGLGPVEVPSRNNKLVRTLARAEQFGLALSSLGFPGERVTFGIHDQLALVPARLLDRPLTCALDSRPDARSRRPERWTGTSPDNATHPCRFTSGEPAGGRDGRPARPGVSFAACVPVRFRSPVPVLPDLPVARPGRYPRPGNAVRPGSRSPSSVPPGVPVRAKGCGTTPTSRYVDERGAGDPGKRAQARDRR